MDVNALLPVSPSTELDTINAFGGARPKRPIRGQQFHQNPPPSSSLENNAPAPAVTPSQYDQNKAIANLQRQVTGLAKQFTELMAAQTAPKNHNDYSSPQRSSNNFRNSSRGHNQSKPRFYPAPLEYTMDGRPVCLYCKNPGHLKRDCRKKAAADLRRPSGNQ